VFELRGLVRGLCEEGGLMLILGFGNKARQGKDTAAEAIRDYYQTLNLHGLKQHRVGIFKFATALYQEVNEAVKNGIWETRTIRECVNLNPTGHALVTEHTHMPPNTTGMLHYVLPLWVQPDPNPEVSALAPYGKHPKLLQWWGTEFRRAQDTDYWTKKLFASIPSNVDIALVTDVRFPNEADGVRIRGGYNINVTRLRKDGTSYFSSDRPVNHASEIAVDGYDWDFKLMNSEGHQALLGEQAVTLAEYLRALGPSK